MRAYFDLNHPEALELLTSLKKQGRLREFCIENTADGYEALDAYLCALSALKRAEEMEVVS